jgi:hypothetical protein
MMLMKLAFYLHEIPISRFQLSQNATNLLYYLDGLAVFVGNSIFPRHENK